LFDSFAYLGSPHTPWSHTLVGWTGEVEELPAPIQTSQTDAWGGTAGHKMPTIPLNKATAPVPVDPFQKPSHPTPDRVVVTRQDRDSLEGQLLTSKFGKILPVWLCEEPESPAGVVTQIG
jgi:trehalose 6-phosphate synthase/phosphatase